MKENILFIIGLAWSCLVAAFVFELVFNAIALWKEFKKKGKK